MNSKSFMSDANLRIAMYAAIVFLILGILPVWPYDYYILLRWIVSGTALYIFVRASEKAEIKRLSFILIAILYNPLIPIYLNRSVWTLFDLIVVGYYLHEMEKLSLRKVDLKRLMFIFFGIVFAWIFIVVLVNFLIFLGYRV